MFGKLLSTVTKVVTLPIDIFETSIDFATGGDGSRDGLKQADLPLLSELRDSITDVMEKLDE